MGMKQCSSCKVEKEVSEFGKNRTRKDGLQHSCRDCRKQYRDENQDKLKAKRAAYYAKTRDAHLEYSREYRAKNLEKLKAYEAKYRAENRERVRAVTREWHAENPEKGAAIKARWQA